MSDRFDRDEYDSETLDNIESLLKEIRDLLKDKS
jgi:large-conductance mechanosensitive channel